MIEEDDDTSATTRRSRVPGALARTAAATPFPMLAPRSVSGLPLPAPGDTIVSPRRCEAPDCATLTTIFIATSDGSQLIHFCPAHLEWAARTSGAQAWWKEDGNAG